ncbi:MAG: hypothetical protein IJQ53_07745 [Clostridia bacterium]|nr:hypothetical protein [Clostridia bacterium]
MLKRSLAVFIVITAVMSLAALLNACVSSGDNDSSGQAAVPSDSEGTSPHVQPDEPESAEGELDAPGESEDCVTVIEYCESQDIIDFNGSETEDDKQAELEALVKRNGIDAPAVKLAEIEKAFDVVSIIADFDAVTYSICNYTASIRVISPAVVNDRKTLLEYYCSRYAFLSYEDIIVYSDEKSVGSLIDTFTRCVCLEYKKEGCAVYAVSVPAYNCYNIYVDVGGTFFEVNCFIAYTYPGQMGVLRAADEWDGVVKVEIDYYVELSEIPAALRELSDTSTESSALVRALKASVGR